MNTSVIIRQPLIFVVGVGRSGTTLVQSMLNAHPKICFSPELHFFRRYVGNGRAKRIFAKKGKEQLLRCLSSDQFLRKLSIDLESIVVNSIQNNGEISPKTLYLQVLLASRAGMSNCQIGDKDPRAVECIPSLYSFFPSAFLIHVIRDPRDTIVSRGRAKWSQGRPFLHHLFVYNAQINMGRKSGMKYFKERYLELIYERLLQNPTETLRQLCSCLGIDFVPEMLNFGQSSAEIVFADEYPWKKEVFGPLISTNTGKWKGVLADWQIAMIESLCGDLMEFYGYPLAGKGTRLSDLATLPIIFSSQIYAKYRFRQQVPFHDYCQ